MGNTIERKSRVNVRLSENMHERASQLADSFGIPLSTLAAFAIGKFVYEQESNTNLREQMLGSMTTEFKDNLASLFTPES